MQTTQQQPKQPELQPVNEPAPKQQDQKPQTKAVATTPKPFKEETFDLVMERINAFSAAGDLKLPKDYSPANAMQAAWLIIQETEDRNGKRALDVCTKESICNSLLKMVVWGLSPIKKQCDFIVYGNKLSCDPEYTGNIVLAKRYGKLADYKPRAIFKGDVFEYEISAEFPYRTKIIKHEQKLENIGGEVIGAYFAYALSDGSQDVEIMNINQIRLAWAQGGAKGNSGAHKNFSDQMAIKTVINRGCKLLIRGSDDSALLITSDEEEAEQIDPARAAADLAKQKGANKKELNFDDAELVEETPKQVEKPKEQPKPKEAEKKQNQPAAETAKPDF